MRRRRPSFRTSGPEGSAGEKRRVGQGWRDGQEWLESRKNPRGMRLTSTSALLGDPRTDEAEQHASDDDDDCESDETEP